MGSWGIHGAKLSPCPPAAGLAEETDKKLTDEYKIIPGVDKFEEEQSRVRAERVMARGAVYTVGVGLSEEVTFEPGP